MSIKKIDVYVPALGHALHLARWALAVERIARGNYRPPAPVIRTVSAKGTTVTVGEDVAGETGPVLSQQELNLLNQDARYAPLLRAYGEANNSAERRSVLIDLRFLSNELLADDEPCRFHLQQAKRGILGGRI